MIFSFVWLGLTKAFQAAAGRNLWIDPRKYPRKHFKYHVRQWAYITDLYTVLWPQDFIMYKCRVKLGRLISWTFI